MPENVKDEEFSILLDCLIEDNFIDVEDLEDIIIYDNDKNIEDTLYFNGNILVIKHPNEENRKEFGEQLLVSLRIDTNAFFIAFFMKALVESGLDYSLGGGFVFTDDDDIKFEDDLSEDEIEILREPFVASSDTEKD